MFGFRKNRIYSGPRLLSGSVKIPAGSETPTILRIGFPLDSPETVDLCLTRGSFEQGRAVRKKTFRLKRNVADVPVYASRRPTSGWLSGHGLRLRLGFVPASLKHKLLWEWLPIVTGSLLLTVLLRTYAFASFFIPSSSMETTIMVGDLMLSWNAGYQLLGQDPRRGEIVVFDHPNPTREMWIKRVIGMPGDVIESYGGQVLVNGRRINEPYISGPSFKDFGPLLVPPDHFFLMGDNRADSYDSRYWGSLPRERIVGRAASVFWPLEHARIVLDD